MHTDKVMARIGQSLGHEGRIDDRKIGEVDRHRRRASSPMRAATARARSARSPPRRRARPSNGDELAEHVLAESGIPLEVIDGDEEARLAFVGTLASLDEPQTGEIGVVDVGGGSTEIVVGSMAADGVDVVAIVPPRLRPPQRPLHRARPAAGLRDRAASARRSTRRCPTPATCPTPDYGLAVAGSATNLRRMVGPLLDEESLARAAAPAVREPVPADRPPVPARAGRAPVCCRPAR